MVDLTEHLPIVSWEGLVNNVLMLTVEDVDNPSTYQLDISPEDYSQPGANDVIEVGFCLEDNAGNIYPIILVNDYTIDVVDIFRCGFGPVTDKIGIVFKSVGNGESLFISPIKYDRLDKSALSNARRKELDALWKRGMSYYSGILTNITDRLIEVNFDKPFSEIPTGRKNLHVYRVVEPELGLIIDQNVLFKNLIIDVDKFSLTIDESESLTGIIIEYLFIKQN